MTISLVQFQKDGERGVALLGDAGAFRLVDTESTFDLAMRAIAGEASLADLATSLAGDALDIHSCELLPAISHSDPHRILVSGTGLTHLGSAEGRDKMHKAASGAETDSMKMFRMGLEGGRPSAGEVGAQPEWFYKGDGSILVGPRDPLTMPGFAEDGGEEPEIAGIYLIAPDGTPWRLGFALGNEFSDHVVERQNYLWLAHSKLRQAALGAELLLGELPQDIRGVSRIRRGNAVVWEQPFLTGEANMSHSIANLEHHHFKNAQFRQPGTLHVHFFGTATLSFSDGVRTQAGDEFEIDADAFRLGLRNRLEADMPASPATVRAL